MNFAVQKILQEYAYVNLNAAETGEIKILLWSARFLKFVHLFSTVKCDVNICYT